MNCPTCKRIMVQLFLTQACDYCDYGPAKNKLHRGFALYKADGVVREEYVFRTRMDVERWQRAVGGDRANDKIVEVWSLTPFKWHLSRGTLRDVVLADHMHEVFPDHKFEPLPHRVFLGQDNDIETQES